MKSPFKNQTIRSLWDKKQQKYWICAVDAIKMLTGNSYNTAKIYWRVYKHRTSYFSLDNGYQNTRLTLPHKTNGKYYTMDVIDMNALIHIIKTIPHKNSKVCKIFLQILGKTKIQKRLNILCRRCSHKVSEQIKKEGKQIIFSVTKIERYFNISQKPNIYLVA